MAEPAAKSSKTGAITLGGDLTVNRLGFGAMRITGHGIWGDPPDRKAAIALLRRVVERMQSFDSDLSLQALANESGYSRVHFVRMFKAATGSSPHNYLVNLKLERARELLKIPSMSLIDIALDCGFSSHSHMSRLFHKFVGVTPSAYRRSLRP